MRLILLLVVLVLLAVPAYAVDVTSCSTLSGDSTTYTLLNNLTSSSGTCITLSGNNSTFDLNGFTITYANTSDGVAINNSGSGNTIQNGTITKGSGNGTSTMSAVDSTAEATFSSITFNITSTSSTRGVYGIDVNGTGDLNVDNCTFNLAGASSGDSGLTAIRVSTPTVVTATITSNVFDFTGNQILCSGCLRPIGVHALSLTNSALQRFTVSNNTFTFGSNIRDGHAVLGYEADGISVYDNIINNYSSDSRMVLLDLGSDYGIIKGNTINMSGSTNDGNNVGIRVRSGDTTDTEIFDNTIDCTGSSGTGDYMGMYLGGNRITNTTVYNNTITSCERGVYVEYQDATDYYNNSITVCAGCTGYWYLADDADTIDSITHGYDAITCADAGDCRPWYLDEYLTGEITNVTICTTSEVDGAAADTGDVTVQGSDTPGYTVTASGCLGSSPAGASGGGQAGAGLGSFAGVTASGVIMR